MQAGTGPEAVRRLRGDDGEKIEVNAAFRPAEGAVLLPGVTVGKLLGTGMAGAVYLLVDSGQQPLGWVLKAKVAGKGGLLSCLFPSWEREYTVGRALTTELDASRVHGFMHTGAMVVRSGSHALVGICLEQMQGSTLDSVLLSAAESAMKAAVVLQMLREVFEALADAQQRLGFRHWDLRLSNVMQHTPLQHRADLSPAAREAAGAGRPEAPRLQYKVIDFGHGNLYDGQLRNYDRRKAWQRRARLGGIPLTEHCYRLFWWHEGDVFRLLMSLQNVLDSCTWRSQDAELAQALQSFIHSVTGSRIHTRVVGAKAPGMSFPAPSRKPGRSGSFRRTLIRSRSFWLPRRPGISAEEALNHQLFQTDWGAV